MKLKKILLSIAFATSVSGLLATPSLAASHVNTSHDYEVYVVNYSAGGVLVPFTVGGDLTMNITVETSGKIVKKETLYAKVPNGRDFPFALSFKTGSIKYYKDGTYSFTHTPATTEDFIYGARDIVSYKVNYPNTNLADSPTYKAVGSATYISSQTFPGSFLVDTTEGVVD